MSRGALVCSEVDVYISGRKHCFNLKGHDKHTAFRGSSDAFIFPLKRVLKGVFFFALFQKNIYF